MLYIVVGLAMCYAIDRICDCIETKYIAESEKEDENTDDNQKEKSR